MTTLYNNYFINSLQVIKVRLTSSSLSKMYAVTVFNEDAINQDNVIHGIRTLSTFMFGDDKIISKYLIYVSYSFNYTRLL